MKKLQFTDEEKTQIVQKVKLYFLEELDQEIGTFDAQFLIDFFAEEVGAYFYNRGLYDAQAYYSARLEEISETIYELEKPTEFNK
ncbi:MAG: DUF2164 domain-containing protein [Halieaceae bacterium]|nr:DUF2164 domain-containing protein [Halieaceae bacterium]MCP5204994.1 DUF2164 domain-containing protein [Pseudomonadales bacterium]